MALSENKHDLRNGLIAGGIVAGVIGIVVGCWICRCKGAACPGCDTCCPTCPGGGGPKCPTGTPGKQAPGRITFYEVDANYFPVEPPVVIGSATLQDAAQATAFFHNFGFPGATGACGMPALYQGNLDRTTYVGGTSPTDLIGDLESPTFGYWYSYATGQYNSDGSCTNPGGFTVS